MSEKTGIQRAVEKFDGSPSKLAAAVGNGVLRQHVEHWQAVGRVSAEKTPYVAAATGLPEEVLNDRVNWALVRQNRARDETPAAAQNTSPDTPSGAACTEQNGSWDGVERRHLVKQVPDPVLGRRVIDQADGFPVLERGAGVA